MSAFPIPPTYANPIIKDEQGRETFNPIWLKWFLDVAQVFTAVGGGGGTISHNSLGSLQGGASGEYYHFTAAEHGALLNGSAQTPASATAGASPYTYHNVSGYTQAVYLTAGTVTNVEFSRDNATYYSAGATPTAFTLGRGDYLRLTHAGAPTMTTFDL